MKRSTLILLVLNVVVWGGLLVMGFQAMHDIAHQHVAGSPHSGQRSYYFYFPIAVLDMLALWVFGSRRLPAWARNVGPAIALFLLPVYLFFYTGGV